MPPKYTDLLAEHIASRTTDRQLAEVLVKLVINFAWLSFKGFLLYKFARGAHWAGVVLLGIVAC